MKRLLAVLALALAGCSTIGHEPVAGWPVLAVYEHRVSAAEMHARCSRYAAMPLACAEFNLATRRCDIWLTPDAAQWVVEHEHQHCRGYDHVGSTAMRDFLQRFQREARIY